MLTVLGGLAEFERELIRSRTSEGRERAKAKGVVMGRKPKLTHHQRQEAIARRETGEFLVDIGRSYNVSHSTISRLEAGIARGGCLRGRAVLGGVGAFGGGYGLGRISAFTYRRRLWESWAHSRRPSGPTYRGSRTR
jgi:hypothetical protein